ncbi:MAG TPA: VWA domain-containing protein [Pyrinomonadaceae bacterium]|nr:VWA domain-containing protein [Pyrinomonadaceae bacterium]
MTGAPKKRTFIFLCLTALLLACVFPIAAQSCVTPDQVKAMVAAVKSPQPNLAVNTKLRDELVKLQNEDQKALREFLAKKEKDKNVGVELDSMRARNEVRFCAILKEYGWPNSKLVEPEGVAAAFALFQTFPSYRLQLDLLPVIVALVDKKEIDRPHFAALFDRMRLRAGRKQLFGTQVSVTNGFLVLSPVENQAQVDARRREFDLPPLKHYLSLLERDFHLPVVRLPSASEKAPTNRSDALDTSALGNLVTAENGEEVEVLRIETNLVSLNVSVYNSKLSTTVGNLEQKDFKVSEDGREQSVSFFAATEVPFDLVLLLDLSSSTSNKRDLIRKSTEKFIRVARPTDRLAIVTFASDAEIVSPLTADRAQLMASLSRLNFEGVGSHVWDALEFSLDKVLGAKSVERRRAVLLMSDGLDNALSYNAFGGSEISFGDLLEKVRHTDAMVIPIYLDTEGDQRPDYRYQKMYENARKTMRLLADESGGLYYKAKKISDLEGVYEQVINDLGKVYSLGYTPTNDKRDGTWRRVKVEISSHPELTPRARPGYYAN